MSDASSTTTTTTRTRHKSKWFYTKVGKEKPRVSLPTLIQLYLNKTIDDSTYVWHKNKLENWTRIKKCPYLLEKILQVQSSSVTVTQQKRSKNNNHNHHHYRNDYDSSSSTSSSSTSSTQQSTEYSLSHNNRSQALLVQRVMHLEDDAKESQQSFSALNVRMKNLENTMNSLTIKIEQLLSGDNKMESSSSSSKLEIFSRWLSSIGMSEYLDAFVSNGFEELEIVCQLSEQELLQDIGIQKKGHRMKLCTAMKQYLNVNAGEGEGNAGAINANKAKAVPGTKYF